MIKTALLSVSDKTGLIAFATFLRSKDVMLLSTGGTAKALREAGLEVKDVSEHTGFPEMLDGRVKTLHPTIHGGLLGIRGNAAHEAAMAAHAINPIDLVVINLYPFEAKVAERAGFEECIENIDIGGPSMVRSAAKNHEAVTVLTDPSDYAHVQQEIEASGGTSHETRKKLAAKAFARTASYDAAISTWFANEVGEAFPERYTLSAVRKQVLRYGENPHQSAAFYHFAESAPSVASAQQLHGKELSYNNINDTDAALELVQDIAAPAVAIIKHANPCGVATGATMQEAYHKALACDPTSAFGGIIALNRLLDAETAKAISTLFVEVIIAPEADAEAQAIITAKKNVRLLVTGSGLPPAGKKQCVKSVNGGLLIQNRDTLVLDESTLKVVTKAAPSAAQLNDLQFAFTVAKHVKSNTIVLVKDGATIGIGAGQMSRIDSTRIACWKADEAGFSTQGAVLASDAFFPFADNVEHAARAGIAAIIQPGGSMRDAEVIEAADKAGLAMVLTSIRHFRH